MSSNLEGDLWFVQHWMLLNMPFGVGFPAWYAPLSSDRMEYHTSIHHYWGEGGIEYLSVLSLPLPLQSHSSVAILWHRLSSGTRSSCHGGREAGCWSQQQVRRAATDRWGGGVGEGDQWGGRSVHADGGGARYGRWSWQPVGWSVFWLFLLVASTNS